MARTEDEVNDARLWHPTPHLGKNKLVVLDPRRSFAYYRFDPV